MGIPGFERFLKTHEGCMKDVSILNLKKETGKNVIVVDGSNFYGQYIYSEFNWICGGIKELVERIRMFVDHFKQIGVELEFFFIDGLLDEGIDVCGSESWIRRHSSFVEYTKNFFLEFWPTFNNEIKIKREYYHTPLHVLPVVLFALRHIFNCKVHFDFVGERTPNTAYYTRNNKCLALLAQDNYYIFYKDIPPYLSLKHLNLSKLTTKQYCADMCARHLNLQECHLYPLFIKPKHFPKIHPVTPTSASSSVVTTPIQKRLIIKISTKLNECTSVHMAREKIKQFRKGSNLTEVFDIEEQEIDSDTKKLVLRLFAQVVFYKYGDKFKKVTPIYGPLRKWTLIKVHALELYTLGKLNSKITDLLWQKEYFNDNILEDFIELPSSSVVYQPLRQKLYDILFKEEEDVSDDVDDDDEDTEDDDDSNDDDDDDDDDGSGGGGGGDDKENNEEEKNNDKVSDKGNKKHSENDKKIDEWCINEDGFSVISINSNIEPIDHPGLLKLWDTENKEVDVQCKWQLFAQCISHKLDYRLLQKIPATYVVPTAVLYYLYHEVPQRFKEVHWKLLKSWEVEVFIAQAVMLPEMDTDYFKNLVIHNVRERAVKLTAVFVYGCQTIDLVIQACGYPVSQHDISLLHFFDGNFFHSLYEKAETRCNVEDLCNNESLKIFQEIKKIILPPNSVMLI